MSELDGWETVIGLEVHCELATRDEAVLRLPQRVRRRAQHQRLPGVPGPARLAAGAQRARRSSWPCGSAGRCTARWRRRSSPGRTTSIRTCRRTTRSASTTSRSTSTARSSCPTGKPVGIERAHIEEDTGKSTHVGGGGRIHGADYSPRRLQPRRRAARRDRERARPPLGRGGQGLRERAARDPAGHRRVRRQDGGGLAARRRQRVGAAAGRRRSAPAARSRTSTRCARWAGPSSTRRAARSSCSRRASAVARRRATGTRTSGRTARCARRRRPTTTATSPSPTSCRRARRRLDRPRSTPRLPALPAARRAALADGGRRGPRRRRVAVAVERELDELVLAAIEAGADPSRVLTHAEHNLAVDGAAARPAAPSPSW